MIDKTHKFNSQKVATMVRLKNDGWSYMELAKRYKCHHSSIIYQYQKATGRKGIIEKRIERKNNPKKEGKKDKSKCPECELLLKSRFFCNHCKDLKAPKLLNN